MDYLTVEYDEPMNLVKEKIIEAASQWKEIRIVVYTENDSDERRIIDIRWFKSSSLIEEGEIINGDILTYIFALISSEIKMEFWDGKP
jgi:hypothetical protein